MENIKLLNIDFFRGINEIDDKSVNLLIADPPYGISDDNIKFHTSNKLKDYKGANYQWDKRFDDLAWIEKTIPKMANDSNIIIFNRWQVISRIADYLLENGFKVKRPIVMKKKNPFPANRDRLFLNSFEFGIWATSGKWTFNREDKLPELFTLYSNSGKFHPTQKPVDFIQKLIRILSNEEDLVFDPFSGSGTTAIACLRENRRYIGFEIDGQYYNKAIQRLNKEFK